MWCISLLMLLCQDQAQEQKPALTPEHKAFFDKLFREGLFDPTGATWCKIATTYPSRPKQSASISFGWVKEGKIYHVNGVAIALSKHQSTSPADLEEQANVCLKPDEERFSFNARRSKSAFPGSIVNPPDLAIAAWCYRTGKETGAARLLSHLLTQNLKVVKEGGTTIYRSKPSTLESLLQNYLHDLQWICFYGLVSHFGTGEDRIALAHGEVLEKHFSNGNNRFGAAQTLVSDIRRRLKDDSADQPMQTALPAEYAGWSKQRQINYLIKELQQVNVRQQAQPGGISLDDDFRVRALIDHDEAALPALLDCMEHDTRLVRSVSAWRDFHPHREVHFVAEAAQEAVYRILKYIPSDGKFVSPGKTIHERHQAFARKARTYWEKVREQSPAERYYTQLQTGKYGLELLGALLSKSNYPSWLQYNGSSMPWPIAPAQMATQLAVFSKPSIAELILRDLDKQQNSLMPVSKEVRATFTHEQRYQYSDKERHRYQAVDVYLRALVVLGDRRVLPELLKRIESQRSNFSYRRKLAMACHRLGDSAPLKQLCLEIAQGLEPVKLPAIPDPLEYDYVENQESVDLVTTLATAQLPESEQALKAIAEPSHRLHAFFEYHLHFPVNQRNEMWQFEQHPYCLIFFRRQLNDQSNSGATVRGNRGNSQAQRIRVCDEVMRHVSGMVMSLKRYETFNLDAQAVFQFNMNQLKRYEYRSLTIYEHNMFRDSSFHKLIPVIPVLKQPASPADVETGKAAFAEQGSKCLDITLPMWLIRNKDVQKSYHSRGGLVFQAEERQGKKRYGVLFTHGIEVVEQDEVKTLLPYDSK